jgi:hypothetical protein
MPIGDFAPVIGEPGANPLGNGFNEPLLRGLGSPIYGEYVLFGINFLVERSLPVGCVDHPADESRQVQDVDRRDQVVSLP